MLLSNDVPRLCGWAFVGSLILLSLQGPVLAQST